MVAIVTGKGTGLERSSAWVLGSRGQVGAAGTGGSGEGVYVNAANGNLVITRQDEFLIGFGPDNSINRTYNSQAVATDGDNNDQWRMSPYRKIVGTSGAATVTRIDWDGSETIYTLNGTNSYICTDGAGAYDTLTWASSQWTWTDGNSRIRDIHDSTGKLLFTRDVDGTQLAYFYSNAGRVSTMLGQNGERSSLAYGSFGAQLLQVYTQGVSGQVLATSSRVRFTYDASNRLQTATVDLSPDDLSITDGKTYVTTYGYDGTSKRVASISQSDGSLLQIGYTAYGSEYRVTSLTQTVASGVTRVTGIFYDLATRTTQITDPLGGVTTMTYDVAGNLTQLVLPAPTPGAAAPTTSYTYNANGDVLSMTENGLTTDYQYDAAGNLTLTRDAAGNTVTRTYGSKNELLTSTEYLVPDPDGAGAGAPDTPVTTRYAYDIENHLRFAVSGEGAVTEYRYDAAGQRTSTIAYAGNKYSVSGLGPTVSIAESTLAAWVADPGTDKSNARRTDTNYDFRGNVRSEVTHARLSVSGEGSTYPLEIVPGQIGQKTSTHLLSDGFYRVTKEGYHATQYYDAEAHSTTKAEGDFVLRLRPSAANKGGIVGVSTAPAASPSWNLDYAFFIGTGGYFSYLESGSGASGGTYVTGDNLWLVRTGSTINYYKGATLEAAMTAGPLRTRTGATGTFYFDCSFAETGGTIDVQFTPLAIANGVNTSVVLQNDRLYRVTKTGGAADGWDADARSSTKAEGDFVLRLRPPQNDKYVVGGVSTAPANSAAYWNPEYGFFFLAGGQVYFMESGTYADFATPVTYNAGDNFWLVRTGSTISYYKGATLEAAKAAGALRTHTGATGTFYFDSSLYTMGSALDAAFTPDEEASSVVYLYDRAGQLLSRINNSSGAQETFIYDGLGRLTSVTDMANATTTFVFDNAASTTTATIAGGLTRVSLYNKAGELISVTESGGNVATAITSDYHDGLGRLRMKSGPTGTTTYYVYDNAGRMVADIDTDGAMTEYVYDAGSRLVKTIGYAGKLNSTQIGMLDDFTAGGNGSGSPVDRLAGLRPVASPTDDRYQWRIYDAANRLIETIDGTGSATVYSYDGASRLLAATAYASQFAGGTVNGWKTTGPTALVLPGTDAANDRVARNFYDKDGLQIGALDGEGGLSENVYDSRGMLIETIRYATPTNVADRAAGTFATLKSGVTATTNPKDIHNWLVNDNRGLLRGRIDGEGNLTRYHYTAAGDVDQIVRGQKLDPAALIATRPVFATLPTAGGQIVETTSYTRDGAGKLLTETRLLADGSGSTTAYGYDSTGRLTARTEAHATVAASTVTQRYDARGNRIGELGGEGSAALAALGANPSGAAVDNVYAIWGIVYSYDAGDRLVARTQSNGVNRSVYYYNSNDMLAFEVNALGEVVEYRYNARGERTDSVAYGTRIAPASLPGLTGGNVTAPVATIMSALANASLDSASHVDFNVDGTIKQSSDPDGNVTTFSYNAFDELVSSVVPRDGAATIQTDRIYDRRGLLKTQIVDAAAGGKAITTSYGYDAFGRAITLTNALSKTTTSTYDRKDRLATQTQSPDNGVTIYTTAYTYDARDNLVAVTDAANKITRYVYDKANRNIATIDALGGVATSTYDAGGRVLATRAYYNTIATGSLPLEVTESALALPGTHAADQVTRYAYDKDGRLRFTVDALMHVAEAVYDAAGNVVRTIAYDGTIAPDGSGVYSATWIAGQVAGLAGAAGTRTARSVYDAVNRLAYAIDATGQVAGFSYDSKGQLIKQVEFAVLYTGTGDPSASAMDTWRAGNVNAADRVTRAFYDRKGQLNYSIDVLGYVTRLEYDKLGNVTRMTAFADAYSATDATSLSTLNTAFASPPGSARITQFGYDGAGRLEQTTDPENYVTKLVLDALGQVTSSTVAFGISGVASTTAYSYDDVGRITRQIFGSGTAEASASWNFYDALGRQTASIDGDNYLIVFGYDALGQQLSQSRYGNAITGAFSTNSTVAQLQALVGANSIDTTLSATYDAFGRPISTTDPRGSVVTSSYDTIGRLLSATQLLEAGTGDDITTSYTYDHFGNAVKVRDARGFDSYSYYDKLGRVVRQVDAEKFVTDTSYTRGGQVATVKRWANLAPDPFNENLFPANPTADPLRDALTTFTYNARDEVIAVLDAEGFTESYGLNAFGERTSLVNKVSATTTYAYDRRGLLMSATLPVTTRKADGTTINVKTSYQYDERGNRIRMIEADLAVEARTTNYAYDKLDRLIATSGDAVTVVNDDMTSTAGQVPVTTIKYDRRGNAIETIVELGAIDARTLAWYDGFGRKIAEASPVGAVTRWTYDGNDNIASLKVFGTAITLPADATGPAPLPSGEARETSYGYDRANRLTSVTVANLRTGEWTGSSWAFATGNVVTTREYDAAGNVVHEEDGRGSDVYSWYDKLGRKTAQVDAENYLTAWTRDSEGNALSETRYATQLGAFTPGPSPPGVSASANDRTTAFTYDRNGRRTEEKRLAVAYTSVSAVGGGTDVAATDASAVSKINYVYNGLGLVVTKIEANLADIAVSTTARETLNIGYDAIGRLTLETGQSFTGHDGATVTPRTAYAYDGLNNVISVRVQKDAVASDTNDRITTYSYGPGGRLATMTDAAEFQHNFGYDLAGRIVRDRYIRVRSDGSSVTEAQISRYDLAGRAVVQTFARDTGSSWLFTDDAGAAYDAVRIGYNVYGEVSGRGITAGPGAAPVYQEYFDYDLGGRMWRSNSGDGVLRLFVYDKAGNKTLTLASTGAALSGLDVNNYTGSIGGTGDTNIQNAVTMIAVFDRRGQRIQTREPDRQFSAAAATEIVTSKAYNAFGEVISETNARNFTTNFTYNNMGRLLSQISPQVSVTEEHGGLANATPTQTYGYDLAGRLVSVTDENGNRTNRLLLAGSGHGESDPLTTKEFHPDTGVLQTKYDVFSDARAVVNEVGSVETSDYDKAGRLTAVTHALRAAGSLGTPGAAVQLIDSYAYDGLGHRIQHWNSYLGSWIQERTDYDAQGRVAATTGFGGDFATYTFAWDPNLVTNGLGSFGGWVKTTVNAAYLTMTERADYFARTIDQIDFGGHNYDFSFDLGGRLVARSNTSGESIAISYYNNGLISGQTGTQGAAGFEYDAAGNRTKETFVKSGLSYRDAEASYDAMNRMTGWWDSGAYGGAPASASWEYDRAGNVRYTESTYRELDPQGNVSWTNTTRGYWYRYDAMNRFTLTKGILNGERGAGTIEIGDTGSQIAYYSDGNRQSALYSAVVGGSRWAYMSGGGPWGGQGFEIIPDGSGTDGTWTSVPFAFQGLRRETYFYTADGYLAATYKADSWVDPGPPPGQYDQSAPEMVFHDPTGSGTVLGSMTLDAMGRTTYYKEWGGLDGTFERANITYDNAGRQLSETTNTWRQDTTGGAFYVYVTNVNYYYTNGLLNAQTQDTYKAQWGQTPADNAIDDSRLEYSYTWWDGALQNTIQNDKNWNGSTFSPDWTTTYYYDASGRTSSVNIADGRPRNVSLVTDQNGMIVDRDENDSQPGGDPRALRYFFAGIQLGLVSNNGTDNMQYVASIHDRLGALPSSQQNGAFRGGSTEASPYADFEQSYDAINGGAAQVGSSYTVNEGDTLQSIAQIVWGDSLLWYLIAQANGLSGGEPLAAGMVLTIPNKVHNAHNNSETFRPYNPNEALGDTSPTAVKPPKKMGACGIITRIIAAVIAFVVSKVIPIPVVGPVLGNMASQAFLIAVGQQKKFDWKSVAITALTAGLTAGLEQVGGPVGSFMSSPSIAGSQFAGQVVQAMAMNAAVQGISVAAGLQKRFDWAGVAAAGVGAAAGNIAGGGLNPVALTRNNLSFSNIMANLGTAGARTFASVATRSLLNGTSFGDNILAALPDVIGNTLGEALLARLSRGASYDGDGIVSGAEQSDSYLEQQAAQAAAWRLGASEERPLAWLNPIVNALSDEDAILPPDAQPAADGGGSGGLSPIRYFVQPENDMSWGFDNGLGVIPVFSNDMQTGAPPAPAGEQPDIVITGTRLPEVPEQEIFVTGWRGSYVVARGQTVGEIAREWGITPARLMEINNISDPRRLREGARLHLPPYHVRDGDTLGKLARRFGTTVDSIAGLNQLSGDQRNHIEVDQLLAIQAHGRPRTAAPRATPAPVVRPAPRQAPRRAPAPRPARPPAAAPRPRTAAPRPRAARVRPGADPNVNTLLPYNGVGYRGYYRPERHYGTAATVARLQAIGAAWNRTHPGNPIQIGEMSLRGGGNYEGHRAHANGQDVDFRMFRTDRRQGVPTTWQQPVYDRRTTHEFLRLVRRMYPRAIILFNDPQSIQAGLSSWWRLHSDHIHISFRRVR